jgi:tetratricopeptide (TPR) repeat protein
MGLVGLVAALALLAAWLVAAARSTGLEPRRDGRLKPEWSTERTALCALALCVLAFGLQSAIDWTWFVPGPSAMALVAGGFVAGRGPLAALGEPRARPEPLWRRPEPARIAAAAAVLVGAGLCAWAVWQPEASGRATDRAFDELAGGDLKAAAGEADDARDVNPYSPEPLYAKAAVLAAAERPTDAYHTLEQAVKEHPRDPDTWLRLARFELDELDLPQRAVESLRGAFHLDPYSPQAVTLMRRANEELGTDTAAGRAQPRERASAVAK